MQTNTLSIRRPAPSSEGLVTSQPSSALSALAQTDSNRAVAEIQAALVVAHSRPRDEREAYDRILNACQRPTLASAAIYQYARGGNDIQGPSIRLAEAIAQNWGNIEFGFREIARGVDDQGVGFSEVMAYAWDLQSNTRRPATFRVRHWRDTKKGGYALHDERDIYELVANQAQRRVRACILSVIPGDVVEDAMGVCEQTMCAKADTSPEAVAKMVEAFGVLGVSRQQIEARIQRNLEAIAPAQIIALRKIYTSLKDGMSRVEDWFEPATEKVLASPASVPVEASSMQADLSLEDDAPRKGRGKKPSLVEDEHTTTQE